MQVARKSRRVLDTAQAAPGSSGTSGGRLWARLAYSSPSQLLWLPGLRPILLASVSLSMAGHGDAEEKIETQKAVENAWCKKGDYGGGVFSSHACLIVISVQNKVTGTLRTKSE